MTYRAVGAGPGPVKTYKVDAPFPWGDNTEIKIPVQAMVDDAWAAAYPHILDLENKLIQDGEDEVNLYAPEAVRKVMKDVVMPSVNTELESVFAQVDVMKEDALKAALAIAGILVVAVGVSAWWVKKG